MSCHVLADALDHLQLFLDVPLIVSKARGKRVGIAAEDRRMILSQGPLDAVGINGLEVGQ